MRFPSILVLLLLGASARANGPTLAAFIENTRCRDTVCMNTFARRYGMCPSGMVGGTGLWVRCNDSRKDRQTFCSDSLTFFRRQEADGMVRYGYGVYTTDRTYARKLDKELAELGFVELRRLPDDAIIYSVPKLSGLDVTKQETSTDPNGDSRKVWLFLVSWVRSEGP
jgi:hypothetical protein